LLTQYTLANLTEGQLYKFRFNVYNQIGWSAYSPETVAIAAGAPAQLDTIELVSATPTAITLLLNPGPDDGGSPITAFVL
jgi:hypothetical protein